MPQRLVTNVLISATLLFAAFGWSGWMFEQTIGNPEVAGDITEALLEQSVLADEIASAVAPMFTTYGVDSETFGRITTRALQDPQLAAEVSAAARAAHGSLLAGDTPVYLTLRGEPVIAAFSTATTAEGLPGELLTSYGPITIPIPSTPAVSVAAQIAGYWALAVFAAVVFAAAAVATGYPRGSVLIRLGRWCALTPLLFLLLAYGAGWVSSNVDNVYLAAFGAVAAAAVSHTIGPLFGLATIGMVSMVVGWLFVSGRLGGARRARSNGDGVRARGNAAPPTPATPVRGGR